MSRKPTKRPAAELLVEEEEESRSLGYLINNFKVEQTEPAVMTIPKLTPVEYRRRIEDGDYTRESELSESDQIDIRTRLAGVIKNYPKIWDWERLGIAKNLNQSESWEKVGVEMYEQTGAVYSIKSLTKWWKYLKEAYRRQIYKCDKDSVEESDWRHFDSMSFVRHTLDRSLNERRKKGPKARRTNEAETGNEQEDDYDDLFDSEDYEVAVEPTSSKKAKNGSTRSEENSRRSATVENEFTPKVSKTTPDAPSATPPAKPQEVEAWERDANYIRDEINRHFQNIKNDSAKLLQAKRKLLNCLWEMES